MFWPLAGTKKTAKNDPKTVVENIPPSWSSCRKLCYIEVNVCAASSRIKKRPENRYMDRRRESKRKSMYKKTARVNLYDPSPKRPKDELRPTPAAKNTRDKCQKGSEDDVRHQEVPSPTPLFQPPKNVKTARVKELKHVSCCAHALVSFSSLRLSL